MKCIQMESSVTTIIGISDSLWAASYNTALLRAAMSIMSDGARLDIASIHDIPLADGLLLATPG